MKKSLILTLLFLGSMIMSNAQNMLYLKNGSILKGNIKEVASDKVSFQTTDGSIVVVSADEVEKISADETYSTNADKNMISTRVARKGYRGYVNITPMDFTFRGLICNITTTHGRQFNPYLFVGGGAGILLKYHDDSFIFPVYAAIKGNVGKRVAQFTYGARLGFAFGKEYIGGYYSDEGYPYEVYEWCGGLYFSTNIGLRLGFTPQYALRIAPESAIYLGSYLNISMGLRLSFEF